jgi:O-antigen/teichoic acid export membrane protein
MVAPPCGGSEKTRKEEFFIFSHDGAFYRDSRETLSSRAHTTEGSATGVPRTMARVWNLLHGLLSGGRPLAALFQSVGTQAIVVMINIVTGVLTARMLGPDGRGVFAAVTTWPQLLATLAIAGLNSAIIFRMRKSPERAGEVAGAALILSATFSSAAIAAGWMLMPYLMARYSAATIGFAQLCLVSVFVNSTQMVVKQGFAGTGQFGLFNVAQLLPQLFYLVALVALMFLGAMTARTAVLALLGGGAIALMVTLRSFARVIGPRLRPGFMELHPVASYSARASLMDIVFTLATYADRIILIPMLSRSELGLYAVAYSFSRVIQMAQPAVVSVVFSHMSHATEERGRLLHDRALRLLSIGLLFGCVGLWIAGKPLLAIAYGAQFEAANIVFRLLVIEASLGALSQVTAQLFLSVDRPGTVSAIQVGVLCASVVLLLILAPLYGAEGAAVALVAAAALRWVCLMAAIKLVLRKSLPRLYLTREDLHYVTGRLR